MGQDVVTNYKKVFDRLSNACQSAGRNEASVTLVAVSKWHSASAIGSLARAVGAHNAGPQPLVCGESYVQEALEKQQTVASLLHQPPVCPLPQWHFIGHIQSRKAKELVGLFSLIHSIDSAKVAHAFNKAWVAKAAQCNTLPVQHILLQVNIGQEPQKSGIAPAEVEQVCKEIMTCEGLHVAGLMCLPPACEEAEEARPYFAALATMAQQLRQSTGLALPHLSMGMSHDFEVAVAEGATIVRVGTDIFGPRQV